MTCLQISKTFKKTEEKWAHEELKHTRSVFELFVCSFARYTRRFLRPADHLKHITWLRPTLSTFWLEYLNTMLCQEHPPRSVDGWIGHEREPPRRGQLSSANAEKIENRHEQVQTHPKSLFEQTATSRSVFCARCFDPAHICDLSMFKHQVLTKSIICTYVQ